VDYLSYAAEAGSQKHPICVPRLTITEELLPRPDGRQCVPSFKQGLITQRARGVLLPGRRLPTVNARQDVGCLGDYRQIARSGKLMCR
jgi:hypothetical protein